MSAASENISVQITADSIGVARADFGVLMIPTYTATWTERTRTYTDVSDVSADFAAGTPEYIAASAAFSQTPHPEQVVIGRFANKPTQVYVIGAATVANTTIYSVKVVGPGVTTTTATYTSDSSATNDEIAAGLVTALNAVVGKNYTAAATGSNGSHVVTVTANAAGNWFSLEVTDVNLLSITQTHVDPGSAADLDAILLENSSWYAFGTTHNSQPLVLVVAAWAQANGRLYIPDVNETLAITTSGGAGGTADTLDNLKTLGYSYVAGAYHPSPAECMAFSWLGLVLSIDVGQDDWKWKVLSGVAGVKTTGTHRVNLRARKANWVQPMYGQNVTMEGTLSSGGFIDNTRGIDAFIDDMSKGIFQVFLAVTAVPFTNAGIALIENAIRASCALFVSKGVLSSDSKPVITVPDVKDVTDSNKAIRYLPDLKFSGVFAGRVHKVGVSGVVSV